MNERIVNRSGDGFSLVTGPGRQPLTRRQADALGRLIGTIHPDFDPLTRTGGAQASGLCTRAIQSSPGSTIVRSSVAATISQVITTAGSSPSGSSATMPCLA